MRYHHARASRDAASRSPARLGLAEDRAVALQWTPPGPVFDDLHEREATGGELRGHEAGGDAVAGPIPRGVLWRPRPEPGEHWREVDNGEHPTRSQGAQEVGVRRRRIAQVVIHPAQDHGFTATARQ